MAEENNNGTENKSEQGTDKGATGGAEEKKYTDAEVNSISMKNEEKAVKKLLKELGITDREKAKATLAAAAAAEAANGESQPTAGAQSASTVDNDALNAALKEAGLAKLQNVLLANKVKADKVEKAVLLVKYEDCLNDDGKFDKSKADAAVKDLLKDWPELIEKQDETNVGFRIGSDGQNAEGSGKKQAAKVAQKPWNRFNY